MSITRKITYINDDGDKADFFDNVYFQFTELKGIDDMSINLTTSQGFQQDGTTLDFSQLDERDMTLKFILKGLTHEEFVRKREEANRLFRPNCQGTLYYNDGLHDVQIRCIPSASMKADMTATMTMTEASVDLLAPNPFFWDREEHCLTLATWEGGFKLPTKVPFKLRHRGTMNRGIENDGHVPIPFRCTFKGPATSPAIKDRASGFFIKLNQNLQADDVLIIDTDYAKKSVQIMRDGHLYNAYNFIDLESDFFYLDTGFNPFEYHNGRADETNEVCIYWRRAYGGL